MTTSTVPAKPPITPAEHYREAQRLAEVVVESQGDRTPAGNRTTSLGEGDTGSWTDRCIALAQVHAILACGTSAHRLDAERRVWEAGRRSAQQWDPGPQPSEYGDERTAPPTP